MSWSREQVTMLIEEYSKYPCLYAVKSRAYSNKHLRQQVLEKMQSTLSCLKPNVTITEIKNKIAGLKATFLCEHKKYISSIRSGADEEEIYHPNLWYYDRLQFLLDHVETRQSIDSISVDNLQGIEQACADENSTADEENIEYIVADDGYLRADEVPAQEETDSHSSSAVSIFNQSCTRTPKKRPRASEPTDVVEEATSALKNINRALTESKSTTNVENDDVALANFIISKLKQITDENVRVDVEEEIVHCLFNGIKKCKK